MISIFDIHKKLGLNLEKGLFIRNNTPENSNSKIQDLYEGDFTVHRSNFKVEYALKKIQPHSFFLFNNEPLLIFFDYSEQNDKERLKKLSRNVWNFNKSALVFVNETNQLNIYNGFQYKRESGLLHVLETIKMPKDGEKLEKYSYWKIVTAELWNERDEDFKKKTRVDTKLLENLRTAREVLIDKKAESPLFENHANRIIGRLIFVRYLIDRKINLDYQGKGKELLTKDLLPDLIGQKDNLFDFFEYLLKKFNGDILPLNGEQDAVEQSHLDILSRLFKGEDIKSRQRSLFNVFNFDFIPIELVSNIYETFLGEKQSSEKAFYTPPFLVDNILEQTVKPFIEKQQDAESLSCKTADFTCGSGIFLCETLRTIINRYIELAKPDKSSKEFKQKIKQLLTENIFGNDVNQEAIEIAKFSLFVTLLDYFEEPKDIEGFEFPYISNNFHKLDIFNDQLDNIFGKEKLIEPDFILGNPPWGKIKESRYLEYCKEREQKENDVKKDLWKKENKSEEDFKPVEIKIGNREFAQAFLLRLSDFSTKETVCQVVVTSKLLYNLQANKFRNYFLENYMINEVLEISSVRHHIFSNAVGPAVIMKYKYSFGIDTKDNLIEYISLKPNPFFAIFKTILIEKYDYKEVIQKELIENDWLWKVLVYGHILDFRFIKRLKRNKNTINKAIDKYKFQVAQGINLYGDGKPKPLHQVINKCYLDLKKGHLKRYIVSLDKNSQWKEKEAKRHPDFEMFEGSRLFIKKSLESNYNAIAAYTDEYCIYRDAVTAIKTKGEVNVLHQLLALLNSSLFTYYILQTGSSTGIEREIAHNEDEKFTFPLVKSTSILSNVKQLIKLKHKIETHKKSSVFNDIKISQYEEQFEEKEAKLNQLIFDLYNLSKTERDLITYAQEITIPILQAKNKKYRDVYRKPRLSRPHKKLVGAEITDYINIFKEHFSKFHNGGTNGYFNVRVIQSENILAIEFYIDAKQHDDEWTNKPDNEEAMERLASMGFQKVSNKLFIQKDVKTLKRNSFSVLKINQYKYWHKAIARLDVIEFSEAMVQSQIQVFNG